MGEDEADDEDMEDPLDDEQVAAMEEEAGEVDAALVEGAVTTENIAKQMMEGLDKDQDGLLSFEELAGDTHDEQEDLENKEEYVQIKSDMEASFNAADKDKDYKLNAEELQAFHQSTGQITQEAQ